VWFASPVSASSAPPGDEAALAPPPPARTYAPRRRKRRLAQKFFADRGTHLAAMIAYFALLAFVPLTFLALSLLGLTGRADESSFLVREIRATLPGVPIVRIVNLVNDVRENAATLGLIGAAFLLWTSLSLFSVLESAFNIVYGRPNRPFLRGKGLAVVLMIGSLVTLFVALLAGSIGVSVLEEYAPGFVGNSTTAYIVSLSVSTAGVFLFLVSVYYLLTNADLTVREVLPGAIVATVILELSFQALPVYVRASRLNPTLHTFGGTAIMLVWLYVMANVIVFGAELNWWRSRRPEELEEIPGLA
jgi:membrane protein